MVKPRNTSALEGSRVQLHCHADGFPDNITYRWFHNGVDVHLLPRLMQVRGQVHADGTLSISSVSKEDTGWYTCRPTNGVGKPPEAEAFLNVTC